jgi:hypothetical protein
MAFTAFLSSFQSYLCVISGYQENSHPVLFHFIKNAVSDEKKPACVNLPEDLHLKNTGLIYDN